jgi:hypothetical protein
MKHLILIIFILFASCQAKKVVQQSKLDQTATIQNDIALANNNQVDVVKKILDDSNDSSETVINTTIYDTDKPVLSTGKPPIKQETTITHHKKGNKIVKTKTKIVRHEESNYKDQSKVNTVISQQIKTVEKVKPPAVKYWLWILIIVIGSVVGFIIYLKWTKIKLIFQVFFHKFYCWVLFDPLLW